MARFIQDLIKDEDLRRHLYTFEEKLEILQAYVNDPHKGNGTIAEIILEEKYYYNGVVYPIGCWLEPWRNGYKNKTLSPYKITKLDNLKMKWSADNKTYETFELKIEVLTAYVNDKDAGNGTIGFVYQQDKYCYKGKVYAIGSWIKAFRKSYVGRDGYKQLERNQILLLEELGMVWDATNQRGLAKKLNKTKTK